MRTESRGRRYWGVPLCGLWRFWRLSMSLSGTMSTLLPLTSRLTAGWSGRPNISLHTIQHCFQHAMKMPCHQAAKKPLLTERMVQSRLNFCVWYSHWTEEDWSKSAFQLMHKQDQVGAETSRSAVQSEVLLTHSQALSLCHDLGNVFWGHGPSWPHLSAHWDHHECSEVPEHVR